jgi:hypothetical protein
MQGGREVMKIYIHPCYMFHFITTYVKHTARVSTPGTPSISTSSMYLTLMEHPPFYIINSIIKNVKSISGSARVHLAGHYQGHKGLKDGVLGGAGPGDTGSTAQS